MDIGTVVGGRYRIVRELGRGGMGVVYEALQEDLRRPVALKVMRGLQCSGEDYDRFVREARIAASVSSPHLVQVLDFSAAPVPFIVMELLTGETLADRLRSGPLAEIEVVRFAQQLLSVLAVVHAQGIIHRDLKPANIFFTEAPGIGRVCKLLDFGIAKLAQATRALTQEGSMLGTVPYMAPEQLLNHAEVTSSADIYALGVCMFEALTGRRPSARVDFAGLVAELQSTPAPSVRSLRADVSPGLAAVVDCAIARHPAQRYATTGAMLAALEAVVGSPASLRPSLAPPASAAIAPMTSRPPGSLSPSQLPTTSHFDLPTGGMQGTGAVSQGPSRRGVVGLVVFGLVLTVVVGVGAGVYWGSGVGDEPDARAPSRADAAVVAIAVSGEPVAPASGAPSPSAAPRPKPPLRGDAGPAPSVKPAPSGVVRTEDGALNTPCAASREGEGNGDKRTVCQSGKWRCRQTLAYVRECGDHCEPVAERSCAACGTPCPSDKICKVIDNGIGECVACDSTKTLCRRPGSSGICAYLPMDPQNCGRCGNVCVKLCINGVCQ